MPRSLKGAEYSSDATWINLAGRGAVRAQVPNQLLGSGNKKPRAGHCLLALWCGVRLAFLSVCLCVLPWSGTLLFAKDTGAIMNQQDAQKANK